MVLLLSERDIDRVLRIEHVIDSVETALKERAEGRAWAPAKARFDTPGGRGYMRVLPGGLPNLGVAAVKTYLDPTGKGSGGTVGLLLYDMNTGSLLSIMSAERLGQLRTAASSVVAARYLARKDASILGVIGSGNQAAAHIEGFYKTRGIRLTRVYSPTKSHRDEFAQRMTKKLGVEIVSVDRADEVVQGAEIVIAATTSHEPVFNGSALNDGFFVSSVGSHLPTIREVDDNTVKRAKLVVDSKEQALQNVGNLVLPLSHGLIRAEDITELGEIIMGRKEGRVSESENVLYHCTGLSIYDVAAAHTAWREAEQSGVGTRVPFDDTMVELRS